MKTKSYIKDWILVILLLSSAIAYILYKNTEVAYWTLMGYVFIYNAWRIYKNK